MWFRIVEINRRATDFEVKANTIDEAIQKVKEGEFSKALNFRQLEPQYGEEEK